jgi:hypothetical protein
VKELIDADLKGWNVPLLEQIFSKEEVQLVQSIPISRTNQLDTLIWRGTANGFFFRQERLPYVGGKRRNGLS